MYETCCHLYSFIAYRVAEYCAVAVSRLCTIKWWVQEAVKTRRIGLRIRLVVMFGRNRSKRIDSTVIVNDTRCHEHYSWRLKCSNVGWIPLIVEVRSFKWKLLYILSFRQFCRHEIALNLWNMTSLVNYIAVLVSDNCPWHKFWKVKQPRNRANQELWLICYLVFPNDDLYVPNTFN